MPTSSGEPVGSESDRMRTRSTLPSTGRAPRRFAPAPRGAERLMDRIEELLELQDGVIARHQAIGAGCTPVQVARRVRRREWTPVHPGVYVNHTGPLTWRQRAWAAVLAYRPAAALDGRSAVPADEGLSRLQRRARLIALLEDVSQRGWRGTPRPCPHCPDHQVRGGSVQVG